MSWATRSTIGTVAGPSLRIVPRRDVATRGTMTETMVETMMAV
jgi:hypothetical protein